MKRLTQIAEEHPKCLSTRLTSPFTLCFRHKLYNGYTFIDMNAAQIKEFQKFLDIASELSFEQVERRYRRTSDKLDTFSGEQVIHYGISKSFRIHGIIENGQFVVLRLDPKHSFHK